MFSKPCTIFFLCIALFALCNTSKLVCKPNELFESIFHKDEPAENKENFYYILYDVNPVEGFNLRRDVFIRFAVFIKKLRKIEKYKNAILVLPPFRRLYHWKSNNIPQDDLVWRHFFNVEDMKRFTAIIDFDEFCNEFESTDIIYVNEVFQLLQFEDMFTNGLFIDKFEFTECLNPEQKPRSYDLFKTIVEEKLSCLKFQGSSQLLQNVLSIASLKVKNRNPKIFHFLNAEIVLHDHWGNKDFWQARRSMRFNAMLVSIATAFRMKVLNSRNRDDLVQRPPDWRLEEHYRGAKGGAYLCAHLRRGDFIVGREKTTPTLRSAAAQIKNKLNELNLTTAFIATDGTKFDYKNLKSLIGQPYQVKRFSPETIEMKDIIKDGGVAIIDQIICSHARYFIGTYESTFTYRIYEEREILGFTKQNTFNTFCRNADRSDCQTNSIWPIVY